ncbi:MAG: CotH kinase family protein [Flavobacteriales bacterium]|jgi:hypothetical protein|nr:CotH kinase family protein [Flavobacteriales bacterium]
MKNKWLLLLLVPIFWACTEVEDEFESNIPSFNSLEPKTINTDLPVVNLYLDNKEFSNMMKNYESEIEIEGTFEMFKNGEKIIELDEVEVEIKGASSSALPMKSLGIKFDKKYKNASKDYNLLNPKNILPHHSLEKIKSIRLRNSGNDFVETMIKDLSLTKLAIDLDLNIDLMYGEPVIAFVNEEFYGVLNLRTESNKHGIAGLFGADKDDVTLVKMADATAILKDGEESVLENLKTAVTSKDVAYLKEHVDIDNFIDYMLFESFVGNVDWPSNNVRFFSIDGSKIRFFLYDLDFSLKDDLKDDHEHFIDDEYENLVSDLFFVLEENAEFKSKFTKRKEEFKNNPKLKVENYLSIVNELVEEIKPWMPYQIDKYQHPETYGEWLLNIEELKLNYKDRYEGLFRD